MSLSNDQKQIIIKDNGKNKNDSGSVEVQVALLTADILKLTDHFKTHLKDVHSRRGLIRKVNLRRTLLSYLKKRDLARHKALITKLKLRG